MDHGVGRRLSDVDVSVAAVPVSLEIRSVVARIWKELGYLIKSEAYLSVESLSERPIPKD